MVVKTTLSVGSNHSASSYKKSSKQQQPQRSPSQQQQQPLSAESQDVDDVPPDKQLTFLQQLLVSMNPVQCLSPAVGRCNNPLVDDDDHDDEELRLSNLKAEVPHLLNDLEHEGKLRTTALQKLYRMTDKDNQKNRVPVVCYESFDTLHSLLPCLTPSCASHDRRQALLLLNNLCIPMENKRFILMDEGNDKSSVRNAILPALLRIFKKRLAESFLAAACLFNLSFYEDGKSMLLNYIPNAPLGVISADTEDDDEEAQSEYACQALPSDNEKSLLRVVESLLKDFTPYLQKQLEHQQKQQQQQQAQNGSSARSAASNSSKPVSTVEAATTRWCMAMLRNLATVPDNAQTIATSTVIPLLAAQCLSMSTSSLQAAQNDGNNDDLSSWSRDSLEDACLMLLLWLSQCGSQGLGDNNNDNATTTARTTAPVDLDESVDGVVSVTTADQQSAVMALDRPAIRLALQGIQDKPGIHGVRAKVILQRMNDINRASTVTMEANGRVAPQDNNNNNQQKATSSSSSRNNNVVNKSRSGVGVDTDVVEEIIRTVESHRLEQENNDDDDDDDDDDPLRVDNITLASF